MKLVFYSPNFYPMIGGLENVVLDLATELSRLGHTVRVLTRTPAREPDRFPFEVVRQAGFWQTIRHIRWGDRFVQFNVSLNGIIPWLFTRRPLVLMHHNLYATGTLNGWLKRLVARWLATVNTGCSAFIANRYHRGVVLPNPFNNGLFKPQSLASPSMNLIFLGRLVSDKGVPVLLEALALLNGQTALRPRLTVVGEGPEETTLRQMTVRLGIENQVSFVGSLTGEPLAALLREHCIMVVPSVYDEPFGIVVLEGIASRCFVVGSDAGGLPEAIGPCGLTFPMGDAVALARVLAQTLTDESGRAAAFRQAPAHLHRHTRRAVAARFMQLIDSQIR